MTRSYIRFWGVRGSHSVPFETHLKVGGNTSCVEINVDNHLLICDAGTGIIPLGEKLATQQSIKELTIILTHYHWDHICGLPFFIPAFTHDWDIRFYGPGESAQEVKQNLNSQMQAPYFPVGTEAWMANINYIDPAAKSIKVGPIDIEHHSVYHPGTTYGYTINTCGKKVIYVSDNECQLPGRSIKEKLPGFCNEKEWEMLDAMNREEYRNALRPIKDADILIHDAQYTRKEYEAKRGWGHSCYTDVVNNAIEANVKELYLYHHDPRNNDNTIEKIREESLNIIEERGSKLKCYVAREGMEIELSGNS